MNTDVLTLIDYAIIIFFGVFLIMSLLTLVEVIYKPHSTTSDGINKRLYASILVVTISMSFLYYLLIIRESFI